MNSKHALQNSLFKIEETSVSVTDGPRLVKEIHFREVLSLPPFSSVQHGELFEISLKNDTASLTHGLHRFPAKFIPQLPRWAIEQFAQGDGRVLDPFMGSGTTLVEGLLRKGKTIGTDIDPLARLIAKAKTDVPSSTRLLELGEEIRNKWDGRVNQLVTPMPDIENFGHWFSNDAWAKLQSLLSVLQGLPAYESERRFLLVIFSSIIRWVSNADDQTQKTYVSGTNKKTPPDAMETFWKNFQKAYRGLKQLEAVRNLEAEVIVKEGADAGLLSLESDSLDLIVTSPPYLDSVDYRYNLMLEYFWLGPIIGVPTRKDFNELRRKGIGAKRPLDIKSDMPAVLSDLVDIDEIPALRKQATSAYLNDMAAHFIEAARCMKDGARYVLVIGNSQTTKGIVPVHDCLIRLAVAANLELEKAFAYRVRRHYMKFPRKGRGGIILIDWIIVLRKVTQVPTFPERLPLPWVTLGHQDVAH